MFTSPKCLPNKDHFCPIVSLLGWIPEGKVQCEVCLKLLHPRGMKRHLSEVHSGNQELRCSVCAGVFRNKSSLDTHKRKNACAPQ